jgi:cell division cycle 20-like protein 1 (cofactor of APC complex)
MTPVLHVLRPTQVTKLCDLGAGDSVCSVSWSQRGTYLSVGTNTGEVQVSAGRDTCGLY